MTTKFAALNSYPRFGIPPRSSVLSALPVAPRQNHRLSLPRIEVLVESDDSDDEGYLLSYHSMRLKTYKQSCAPSPDGVDDLEKKGLVSPDIYDTPAAKKNPIDMTNKWDYYVAPLSPLSDLTESDTSDSDDDFQSKSAETQADEATIPRSNAQMDSASGPHPPSPSSSGLKRKRSCDSGITCSSPTASTIKDSEGPSTKRLRRLSGISSEAESPTAASHAPSESMSPKGSKKSSGRHGMTFGTVRKPRVASLRQKRTRSKDVTFLVN